MGVYRPGWLDSKVEYYNNLNDNTNVGGYSMETPAGGAVGTDIAGTVIGAFLNLMNMKNQNVQNAKNWKRQKELTEAQWDQNARAFQTAVSDARAAGLSPLAAIDHPTQFSNAIYSDQVAPQFDISSILGSLSNAADNMQAAEEAEETKRHNQKQEKEAEDRLEIENEKLKAANDAATKLFKRQNAQILYKAKAESKQEREKQSSEWVSNLEAETGTKFKIKYIDDWSMYIEMQAKCTKNWGEIEKILNSSGDWDKIKQSWSSTSSNSGSIASLSKNESLTKSGSIEKNKAYYYSKAVELWERGYREWQVADRKPTKKPEEFYIYQYAPKYEELKDPVNE